MLVSVRAISTLELSELVKELGSIKGFYIEKFYEIRKDTFRFKIRKSGENLNIICVPPYALNITEYVEPSEKPTNFAIAVRKRIEGFSISSVYQLNEDRLMVIELSRHEDKINIIIEMFGRGNLIIADKDMKILLAYSKHEHSERNIRHNITYEAPQSDKIKISDPSKDKIEDALISLINENQQLTILEALSKSINIGTLYLEDAILREGMDKDTKLKDLDQKRISKLSERIQELAINGERHYMIYIKDDMIVDYSMIDLVKYSGFEKEEMETIQKALDKIYNHEIERAPKEPTTVAKAEKAIIERLSSSIEKQRSYTDLVSSEEKEAREYGDYIFGHLEEINKIIKIVSEKKEAKEEDLERATSIKILKINRKERNIIIEA